MMTTDITGLQTVANSSPELFSGRCDTIIIGEAVLNSRDVLRVSIGSFQGRATIDARKFYLRDDGSLNPTPKGLTLALHRLPMLADLLNDALARARADRLLPDVERQ
jgi:hypothetical protein